MLPPCTALGWVVEMDGKQTGLFVFMQLIVQSGRKESLENHNNAKFHL